MLLWVGTGAWLNLIDVYFSNFMWTYYHFWEENVMINGRYFRNIITRTVSSFSVMVTLGIYHNFFGVGMVFIITMNNMGCVHPFLECLRTGDLTRL